MLVPDAESRRQGQTTVYRCGQEEETAVQTQLPQLIRQVGRIALCSQPMGAPAAGQAFYRVDQFEDRGELVHHEGPGRSDPAMVGATVAFRVGSLSQARGGH